MTTATLRPSATAWPKLDHDLRARLAEAAERLIDALDALDAPDEDIEPDEDHEPDHDDEASLGATDATNQNKAWAAVVAEPDAEYEGDTVADCDLEEGHDREDDPAEMGIADLDGVAEQIGTRVEGYDWSHPDDRMAARRAGKALDAVLARRAAR